MIRAQLIEIYKKVNKEKAAYHSKMLIEIE
jgi:hypothetical protein